MSSTTRVLHSLKQTKRRKPDVLKEGWMVHYTSKETERMRHYWRLNKSAILFYQNETTPHRYGQIKLDDVISLESPPPGRHQRYVFTVKTRNIDYYVGVDSNLGLNSSGKAYPTLPQFLETGLGAEYAKTWQAAISYALRLSRTEDKAGQDSAATAAAAFRALPPQQLARPKESLSSSSSGAAAAAAASGGAEKLYKIFADEVLGSGQFGTVHGGVHRATERPVAVKVVNKGLLSAKLADAQKNEVAILQNLSHPGVINLEQVFETPEKIFIVMEKLQGDMFNMITSSEKGRLNERVTKFLVTQILVALNHLHSKNIVHCDLKPENVLLSSRGPYPQVKLCDFGFARIIGENSFRLTMVGTRCYLAPEVLSVKGYNRSLDLWSVGVIIYVTLSGTFPFDSEERFSDQLPNYAEMYPPDPWKEISLNAVDMIRNLLQIVPRKRLSVNKSLSHAWLQDYQTWCDLRDLESRVGVRYVTHESDDPRWEAYGQKYDTLRQASFVSECVRL